MLKVLVWQVSDDMSFKDKAIKILEQQHNGIEIVGEAVNENIAKVDGRGNYEVLLCVGAKKAGGMSKVTENAHKLNLPEKKLLGDYIVCVPGFTLYKYRQLQNLQLSIFSMNCLGGMFSNMLNFPFRSPFINLWLTGGDFIKFLSKPHEYLEEKLVYKGQKFIGNNYEYPVAMLGDITLYMLHYKNFEESVEAWERRKVRINWDNLLVMMFSESQKEIEQFDALPYGKKICFVPFKSDLDSAWYINPKIDTSQVYFVYKVNNFGKGLFYYYDPFDMLLYGKKTPLTDVG